MNDMNTKLESLFSRWDTGEGKPYKGALFDFTSFDGDESEPTDNLACMCAQGQILAIAGGWVPKQFRDISQPKADKSVADILNISRTHSILLRNINDRVDGAPSIVLRDPSKVIGSRWSKLLDFWWMTDTYTSADWAMLYTAREAAREAAWENAREAAWEAAWEAVGCAVWEIQGLELLCKRGRNAFFLPMFGIKTLDDIPARPADYGLGFVPNG